MCSQAICVCTKTPLPSLSSCRITLNGMKVSRPDVRIGRFRMIKHERDKHNEPNPQRYRSSAPLGAPRRRRSRAPPPTLSSLFARMMAARCCGEHAINNLYY